MPKKLFAVLSLCLSFCACGKKDSAPKETQAPKQAISVDAPDAANSAPPPPPAPNAPPAQDPAAAAEPEPAGPAASDDVVAVYNRELSAWINARDYVPTDLEDLKKRTGLPPLPKAPPGKKIVYKPNTSRPTQSMIVVE